MNQEDRDVPQESVLAEQPAELPVGQETPDTAPVTETTQHRGPKRAGYTKNKGKGQSKARRRMSRKSQQINRKRA